MSDINVPLVRTKFTTSEFIHAIVFCWDGLFKTLPTKEQVGILWAQYTLETGGGGACWNFNIGNIKKIRNDAHKKYLMLPGTWEIINGKRVTFQPPSEVTWFRAYDTLQDGVSDYVKFLSKGRYKHAFAAMRTGSPEQFAHLLKVAGYYTAPEEDYVKLVRRGFNTFMKTNDYDKAIAELGKVQIVVEVPNDDIQIGPKPITPLDYTRDISIPDDGPIEQSTAGKIYNFFFKRK